MLVSSTRRFKKKSNLVLKDGACNEDIATAMYQPNTAQTLRKTLFQVFSHQSMIPCSLTKDFNGEGEIKALFKRNLGIASKHRPLEYDQKPLASNFDADENAKLLLLRLLPFEDYNDCIESIIWKLGKAFGVRGSIEMSELAFDR